MNLAIFGATGGLGRHLVGQALTAGHSIRALTRSPDHVRLPHAVKLIVGDVRDAKAVAETVAGADTVFSCLGTRLASTFRRRTRIVAPATVHIVEAMRIEGVRRLIAVSTYGAGDSWPRLELFARLLMGSLLWGELADKNAMEATVKASSLDWTIIRPVNLSDRPATGRGLVDMSSHLGFSDWIARADVAAIMLAAVGDPSSIGRALLVKSSASPS